MSGADDPIGDEAVPVQARALVRGAEIDTLASLDLREDRLVIVAVRSGGSPRPRGWAGTLAVPYDDLEGTRLDFGRLTLFLRGGDLIELLPAMAEKHKTPTAGLGRVADEIAARACRLPELTLSLRSLGSHGAGPEHDEFFGPLLAARAAAERVRDPLQRVRAVDASWLRGALDASVRMAAARRAPGSPPDRRALEAELAECTAPLASALRHLGRLAAAVREAPDDVLFIQWREWAAGLGLVFSRADRCWESSWDALSRETRLSARPSAFRRLWRRIRRDR